LLLKREFFLVNVTFSTAILDLILRAQIARFLNKQHKKVFNNFHVTQVTIRKEEGKIKKKCKESRHES
jgi:hypothetical protein